MYNVYWYLDYIADFIHVYLVQFFVVRTFHQHHFNKLKIKMRYSPNLKWCNYFRRFLHCVESCRPLRPTLQTYNRISVEKSQSTPENNDKKRTSKFTIPQSNKQQLRDFRQYLPNLCLYHFVGPVRLDRGRQQRNSELRRPQTAHNRQRQRTTF